MEKIWYDARMIVLRRDTHSYRAQNVQNARGSRHHMLLTTEDFEKIIFEFEPIVHYLRMIGTIDIRVFERIYKLGL